MNFARIWKWFYLLCILLLVADVAYWGLDWLARRGGALPTVPEPNGYGELLAIAGKVRLPAGGVADLSAGQVREIAETNRAVVEKVHAALRSPTGVPLKVERGWSGQHEQQVRQLRRLAVALALVARADQAGGHTNEAASRRLDMVLLGQAVARGGLVFDGINGLTVETLGCSFLKGDLPVLEASVCRATARELEQAESRRDAPERILETERRWSVASYGLVRRIGGLLLRDTEAKRRSNFTSRSRETIRSTRRLMLALAARAAELETGKRPSRPSDLVPAYLSAVPIDPGTGVALSDIPILDAGE